MTITTYLLATLVWASTWLLTCFRLRERLQDRHPPFRKWLIGLWILALCLHGGIVLQAISQAGRITIHFTNAGAIIMWLASLLLFITMLTRPLETLGIFVIPFTLGAMLLPLLGSGSAPSINLESGLGVHVFTSLLAYSILTLAALQALLLTLQNRHLRNHHPCGLIRTLPPLLDMEALLFKLILLGVILLSFGLLSGTIYVDNLFSQHLAHKTLLSLVAWVIFGILLIGHWKYGWRGRIAIRWTLSGFFILMLAFFGSKFVLEYLVTPS